MMNRPRGDAGPFDGAEGLLHEPQVFLDAHEVSRGFTGFGGVAANDVDAVRGGFSVDAYSVALEGEVALANVELEVFQHLVLRECSADLGGDAPPLRAE